MSVNSALLQQDELGWTHLEGQNPSNLIMSQSKGLTAHPEVRLPVPVCLSSTAKANHCKDLWSHQRFRSLVGKLWSLGILIHRTNTVGSHLARQQALVFNGAPGYRLMVCTQQQKNNLQMMSEVSQAFGSPDPQELAVPCAWDSLFQRPLTDASLIVNASVQISL